MNRALLARQMLLERERIAAEEAVERLVGVQAQQTRPPFIGLWTRLDGFERTDLARLLQERVVVRATWLRGTLHLMTARDYAAFRTTFQPMLTAGMHSILRDRAAGLDIEAVVAAARAHFERRPGTFTELRTALSDAFPAVDERALGYAVRMHLPLVIVPDGAEWGFRADGDFAVAESWLGSGLATEAALETLTLRYLAAFGPATPKDMQVWSGISGLSPVFEALRPRLVTLRDDRDRELFDLPDAPRPAEDTPAPVRFIADFDNVLLAHNDRTRIIADEHRARVVTKNLLVLSTFLVDGFVAGTWKTAVSRRAATLTILPFEPLAVPAKEALTAEGERLARFAEPAADRVAVDFADA